MTEVQYSICATHYNNIEYIDQSVGVFADMIQGRPEFELIIADAGSNDGSLDQLKELANEQSNVRVIVEEGCNIGEGRRLAARAAYGEILIQVMDLDADYDDGEWLFNALRFYDELREEEGEIMLSVNVLISSSELLQQLGGWTPLPANEETELRRRAVRAGVMRFCPLDIFGENYGREKGFLSSISRFYQNSKAKFQSGVSFWYMLGYWLLRSPGLKPKMGGIIVFPYAWFKAKRSDITLPESYDRFDPYILDFEQSVYSHHPELWLDPPEYLAEYADTERMNHITGDT